MVEGLIGKKVGMTQGFDEAGNVVPLTVIKAGPCTVIQKKSQEKDGYAVLQLGLVEEKPLRKPKKPLLGHLRKSKVPPLRIMREFRFDLKGDVKEGDRFFVDIFQAGEKVQVVGRSKGKGFAGVVKRWGFKGGKASHGSMFHRAPGSIGASAFPSRVFKGTKLPGHMGQERVTVRNLTVFQADKENNLLVVKGAVPGASGGYLLIKKANFQKTVAEGIKKEEVKEEDIRKEEMKKEAKKEDVKKGEVKEEKPKKEEVKKAEAKKEEAKKKEEPKKDVKNEEAQEE
jgi:large subunit ribosomal protein L3